MKKKFLLGVLSILFYACNADDEQEIADSGIAGQWVLTNVSCFCGFDPETDFTLTELIFEPEINRVTVIQNGDWDFFRQAGVYYYGGQGDQIDFADNIVYRFEVSGTQLTLTFQDNPQIADDEVSYSFERKIGNP